MGKTHRREQRGEGKKPKDMKRKNKRVSIKAELRNLNRR